MCWGDDRKGWKLLLCIGTLHISLRTGGIKIEAEIMPLGLI